MSGAQGYVPITVVNVAQQEGPIPNLLQRRGGAISQGATTLTPGTYKLITQPADLASVAKGVAAISTITFASGTVTVTAAAAHGIPIGDVVPVTIIGAVPAGYNGTWTATATTTTAFTFALVSSPGTMTTPGTYTLEDVAEVEAMISTFFAQGNGNSCYVIELGEGQAADGLTAMTTFLNNNAGFFYSFLTPHSWGVYSAFYTSWLLTFNSTTAKTYFHITTTLAFWQANPTLFAATLKCAIVTIEAPAVATAYANGTPTEFSAAAGWYQTLNLNPSSGNLVTQAAYSYLFGVTAYPIMGNGALFVELSTANINIVGTGAEGGVTNDTWLYGTTLDGNDFNKYWYAVDNVQLNLDLNTSNAVLNGSNNPQAPLDYNQPGINQLQAVAVATMSQEQAYNLVLGSIVAVQLSGAQFALNVANGVYTGQCVINAIPFANYTQLNPSDYTTRVYKGLQIAFIVQNGFRQIVYNVTVSNFV